MPENVAPHNTRHKRILLLRTIHWPWRWCSADTNPLFHRYSRYMYIARQRARNYFALYFGKHSPYRKTLQIGALRIMRFVYIKWTAVFRDKPVLNNCTELMLGLNNARTTFAGQTLSLVQNVINLWLSQLLSKTKAVDRDSPLRIINSFCALIANSLYERAVPLFSLSCRRSGLHPL